MFGLGGKLDEIIRLLRILVGEDAKPPRLKLQVKFGASNSTKEKTSMSTGSGFNAPDNEQVPYTIDLTESNPDGSTSPYTLQAGDVVALTSTDGHSTVIPNPADPTGATGNVADTAGFVGPVTGALSF